MQRHIYIFFIGLSLLLTATVNARDAKSPLTNSDIIKIVKENDISFVHFSFSDLNGNLKDVSIPAPFVQGALKDGLNFDGSSVPGCSQITKSDMHMKPEINTFAVIPTNAGDIKQARILCQVTRNENEAYEGDPRYILKKTLQEASDLGYTFNVGPEIEFFLLDKQDLRPVDNKKYFDAEDDVLFQKKKMKMVAQLTDSNFGIEKLHHEVASGQHEVSLKYGDALDVADRVTLTKHQIKTLANESGLLATFMPKPISGQNGSAMHIHFSLWDNDENKNAFYDGNDTANLSQTAKYFIAGVLNRINEMNSIFNSTINSYKRLVPGYEAPIFICWGTKNRTAMIRVPRINEGQASAARAEIRSPDVKCNPYLAFAALLKAGLEGVKNQEVLREATEENVYKFTGDEIARQNIRSLPVSLREAVDYLEDSEFARELLGEAMHQEFLKQKRAELADYNTSVTSWEVGHYL